MGLSLDEGANGDGDLGRLGDAELPEAWLGLWAVVRREDGRAEECLSETLRSDRPPV